jgi:protein-tyrosine kinase
LTRIYEALKHASQIQISRRPVTEAPEIVTPMPAPLAPTVSDEMDSEILTLYQAVESLLAKIPRKLVMFMGSQPGEGTSTLARAFATLASEHMNKRVLLFDADRQAPNQKNFYGVSSQAGWQDANDTDGIQDVICRIGASRLYLCPSSNNVTISPEIFDTRTLSATLASLQEKFDLVVIDAPPPQQAPDGLALAPHMDGVILVVEAENTRWKVVENTKNRLMASRARILGMVFNKRRFYIPEYFYRLIR